MRGLQGQGQQGTGDQHRITSVNLVTATPLRGRPAQRLGFVLSKSQQWLPLSAMFDEPSLAVYFKTFNFLHSARWLSLGRFPRVTQDQPKEPLSPRWTLFMANFDGDWDAYFATFMQAMGEGVYDIWGQSVEYPGFPARGRAYQLVDWLNTRIVPSQHYYAAYPLTTANDVRAAARVRRELLSAALDLRVAGTDPDCDVSPLFDDLVRSLRQCLGPVGTRPGGWPDPPAPRDGHMEGVCSVFPVLPGHEDLVEAAAGALGPGPASPFSRLPGTHFARILLIHRQRVGCYPDPRRPKMEAPLTGQPALVEMNRLANSYLVVAADVDGGGDRRATSDRFFRALHLVGDGAVHSIFSHCFGFATVNDERDFADLAWRGRRPLRREYMDHADESLRSVLAALAGHAPFVEMVRYRNQGGVVTAGDLLATLA